MEDIKKALDTYLAAWQAWHKTNDVGFGKLRPTQVGWKVADEAMLGSLVDAFLPHTTQAHIGTVDNRKIAVLLLSPPVSRVPLLQIMQRRPDSTDALGLDHVAFYCPEIASLEAKLKTSRLDWEHQRNPGHAWISVWFEDADGRRQEAKFFDHTSFDIGAIELQEASDIIKDTIKADMA